VLNVCFHRDDIGSRPITAPKFPSHVPAPIDRCKVILVDDVCYSGRTIRAAMDELFEHGRPKWVRLLTLVDRGNRVLPIQPDFAPIHLEIEPEMSLKLVIDHEDALGNRLWVKPLSSEEKESPIS
jgi:pyrimidine operon attenuation protein / uracil phosphoribosyltransferase